jgi:4-amino-4-deoxy-L-arabinose transferase-like glycosyltransferase
MSAPGLSGRASRTKRAELGVALAAAFVFLVGLGGRDLWEPDEPRHGAIAEEMRALRYGPAQLVVPRLNGEPYSQKPPLYYWLAAGAGMSRGFVTEGAARLPSALAAFLTVLVVLRFGRSAFGAAAGLGAAAILATVPAFVDVARNARPDALLALFVAVALWMVWRLDRGIGAAAWNRRALHLAMGCGLLTKGPVAVFLPVLGYVAYLAWEGRLRDFAVLLSRGSWLLSVGVALAWLGAALLLTPEGFFRDAVTENLFARYFAGASHDQPLLFYLKRLPVAFLPWALVWPLALAPLRAGLGRDADPQRRRALRLLIAFVGMGFLFFTLSAGKRVIYLVPLFPALALLTTEGLRGGLALARRVPRGAAVGVLAAGFALGAALLAAFAGARAGLPPAALGLALAIAAVLAALPWERVYATEPILARGFVLAVAAQVAVFGWLLPRLDPAHSIRAAAVAAAAFAPEGTPIGLLRNGSMVGGIAYYSGRLVLPVGGERGVERFVAAGGRALILETPHLPAIEERLRPRIVFRQEVDDDEILVVVIDDPGAVAQASLPSVGREDDRW